MIPLKCFLHRIFPFEHYEYRIDQMIDKRIFKPRKDVEELKLQNPVDWEAVGYFEDRNLRMLLQGWGMFHSMMNVFDSYQDKNKIVDYFFDLAKDWYGVYGDDPDDFVTSRMPSSYAWYDMSVGFRALIIAFFIDRIAAFNLELSDEKSRFVVKLAKKHLRHLSHPEVIITNNNHGLWQLHGLMALSQCLDIKEYEVQINYVLIKIEEMALTQFDDNGVHREHSPHYHFYVLNLFKCAIQTGWYDHCDALIDKISMAEQVTKWFVDPLKRTVCIGDSVLATQEKVDFSMDGSQSESKPECVMSNFNDSGYSIIRSRWDSKPETSTYLFFTAGYHSKVHKHRDCLSFEWFENGERLICDSGKYGYKTDKFRSYVVSNRAHNTVEIDGLDILRMGAYGSALKKTEQLDKNTFLINGRLDYPAIYFDRELYLRAGEWIIVKDVLKHKRERRSVQWFHLAIGYNLKVHKRNRFILKSDSSELIVNCLNDSVTPSFFFGDEERMQGFISEEDYEIHPSLAIGFATEKKEDELITIIALDKNLESEAKNFVRSYLV